MSRPSKLKRAIKEIEDEVESLTLDRDSLDATIADRMSTIEMLKKIEERDNEKNNKD